VRKEEPLLSILATEVLGSEVRPAALRLCGRLSTRCETVGLYFDVSEVLSNYREKEGEAVSPERGTLEKEVVWKKDGKTR